MDYIKNIISAFMGRYSRVQMERIVQRELLASNELVKNTRQVWMSHKMWEQSWGENMALKNLCNRLEIKQLKNQETDGYNFRNK